MPAPRTYLRGAERTDLMERLRLAYEGGASIRDCMNVGGKSYGLTHRLLEEAGVTFRPRGGERWKNRSQ